MQENAETTQEMNTLPSLKQIDACFFCNSSSIWYSNRQEKWICYTCKNKFEKPLTRPIYRVGKIKRKTKSMSMITRQQLLYLIENISDGNNILRDRALVSFIYLTGARISEIVGRFRKYQLEEIKSSGFNNLLVQNLPVLKSREPRFRNVPIDMTNEAPFIKYIKEYFDTIGDGEIAFPISRFRAYKIIKKNTGLFCHYFRHLRITHLVTQNNFSSSDLVQFTGWADSRPSNFYAHLSWQDLAMKMKNRVS